MTWMILGAAAGLLALLYLGAIHASAAGERARRRRGETQRIAARIVAPRDDSPSLAEDAALILHRLRGLLDDQPLAVPLLAAILAGGVLLILGLDPILDDPVLFRSGLHLPGWVKGFWAGCILLLVVGHAVWIALNAPKYLSRHWLLLHPDGAISAEGAHLPRFDPALPIQHFEGISIPTPGAAPRWAAGAVLVQGDAIAGFVYFPNPPGAGDSRPLAITPATWWRIELAPDHARFDDFLHRHYPPGIRAVAPGWPP